MSVFVVSLCLCLCLFVCVCTGRYLRKKRVQNVTEAKEVIVQKVLVFMLSCAGVPAALNTFCHFSLQALAMHMQCACLPFCLLTASPSSGGEIGPLHVSCRVNADTEHRCRARGNADAPSYEWQI